MRLIKRLGPAMIAAVTAMLFVGVSSALAIHEGIGLCKAEELLLCAAGNLITPTAGDVFLGAQIGTGKFIGGPLTEECSGGILTAEPSTAVDKNPYIVKNMSFTLSGCTPCKVAIVKPIVEAKVSMKDIGQEPWTLKWPGLITFEECTFGATCIYGESEVTALIEMENQKLARINTNGSTLKFEGGTGGEFLCGKETKWQAKFSLAYDLGGPGGTLHEVWPTLLEKK